MGRRHAEPLLEDEPHPVNRAEAAVMRHRFEGAVTALGLASKKILLANGREPLRQGLAFWV
jgi:hypothetical protein